MYKCIDCGMTLHFTPYYKTSNGPVCEDCEEAKSLPYKHVGMTGTRDGMTEEQKESCSNYLQSLSKKIILHHGDCIGADADAHDIAVTHNMKTHIHPPIKDVHRAFKEGDYSEEEKSYFARNRDIVDSSIVVLGFPKLRKETKGGTWYTINYAKNKGTPLVIVWPDGELEFHNAG